MESWRKTFREGLVPLLSTQALEGLQRALATDDQRLMQGATTVPPPLQCVQDWPCEGADAIGFAGMAEGLETVGEVEEFFARICYAADERLGEPAGIRWFLNWYDDTPRPAMVAAFLPEVELALAGRQPEPDVAA